MVKSETTLTDKQRAQWEETVRRADEPYYPGLGLIGVSLPLVSAVAKSLAWLEEECEHLEALSQHHQEYIIALHQDLGEKRAALAFYADEDNWYGKIDDGLYTECQWIMGDAHDGGEHARAALALKGES